jgi:hypothetical protein
MGSGAGKNGTATSFLGMFGSLLVGCLVAIILSAADFDGSVSGGSIRGGVGMLRLRREDRFAIFPATLSMTRT